MWGILLVSALVASALVAVAAHLILRTPELLLVAYSWLRVERMDGRREEAQEPGRRQQRPLHRPQWEADTVYLVQWPVSPGVRSISPFALKVTGLPGKIKAFN